MRDKELLKLLRYCIIMIGLENFTKYLSVEETEIVKEWIISEA